MSLYLDTNVIVRHLTGDPPGDQATRATALFRDADALVLTDVIFAETAHVLRTFYRLQGPALADLMRSLLVLSSIECESVNRLLRTLEVYERERIDLAEAYLVARAEEDVGSSVVSFDRAIDRVRTISRIEP